LFGIPKKLWYLFYAKLRERSADSANDFSEKKRHKSEQKEEATSLQSISQQQSLLP
jgi:hypothetical protein